MLLKSGGTLTAKPGGENPGEGGKWIFKARKRFRRCWMVKKRRGGARVCAEAPRYSGPGKTFGAMVRIRRHLCLASAQRQPEAENTDIYFRYDTHCGQGQEYTGL